MMNEKKNTAKRRSALRIMGSLIGLVKPLLYIMMAAIILGTMQGVDLSVLAWALSMGTDVGGSATPIGASANVVGTSVAAKNGYMIGWGKYCRTAVPATIIVVLISMVCIFIRYC